MTKNSIDQSKAKLRDALSRLEDAVEKRVSEAGQQSGDSTESSNKISALEGQLSHVKQENEQLHEILGSEKDQSRVLKKVNTEVAERVDKIIEALKVILESKEQGEEENTLEDGVLENANS